MPNPVRPNHHRFTSESSHAYRESRLLENFISWIINFATLGWFRTRCPGSLCITWTTHVFRLLLEEAPNVIRTKTANGTHTHTLEYNVASYVSCPKGSNHILGVSVSQTYLDLSNRTALRGSSAASGKKCQTSLDRAKGNRSLLILDFLGKGLGYQFRIWLFGAGSWRQFESFRLKDGGRNVCV